MDKYGFQKYQYCSSVCVEVALTKRFTCILVGIKNPIKNATRSSSSEIRIECYH